MFSLICDTFLGSGIQTRLIQSLQHCSEREFACFSGYECIPASEVCNNESDCDDGSDEDGCGKSFHSRNR